MAGSFKLPKVVLKQKKDLELPNFLGKVLLGKNLNLAVLARCIWPHKFSAKIDKFHFHPVT